MSNSTFGFSIVFALFVGLFFGALSHPTPDACVDLQSYWTKP